MKKIIILGAFRFPEGDAAAKRVLGFGRYFHLYDYSVEFVSWGNETEINKKKQYEKFSFVSMGEFNNGRGNIVYKLFKYLFMGFKTIKYLKSKNMEDVSMIIAYHGTSIFLIRLWLFCNKHKIKLIFDCTEWYDYNHLAGGKFGIVALDNALRMNFVNLLPDGLIVISSYLYNFYKNKTKHLVKVPFLIDVDNTMIEDQTIYLRQNSDIELLYIGNPGKKDKLEIVFSAINLFNKSSDKKIFFNIYGITKKDYIGSLNVQNKENILKVLNESQKHIVFKGRISNKEVGNVYKNCHFSILLRPNERYAKAGFPTKLVESLSFGVPMIASDVGDIGKYIIEGENGFLLSELYISDLMKIFIDIKNLDDEKYQKMKENAKLVARKNFHYKNNTALIDMVKGVYEKNSN